MKRMPVSTFAAAAGIGLTGLGLTIGSASVRAETRIAGAAQAAAAQSVDRTVERGAYLVKIMACNDCHTPWTNTPRGPEPDMTRMLSGHPHDASVSDVPKLGNGPWVMVNSATNTAFAGPWGVSFTANLTPDRDTGLGKWTPETFISTLRNGRHEGQGRPILPPMPWPMYRNATDDDLRAVFAYLQSIPAISNRVPQPIEPPEE